MSTTVNCDVCRCTIGNPQANLVRLQFSVNSGSVPYTTGSQYTYDLCRGCSKSEMDHLANAKRRGSLELPKANDQEN